LKGEPSMGHGKAFAIAVLLALAVFCGGIIYGLYNPSINVLRGNNILKRIVMLNEGWQMITIYMNNLAVMFFLYIASVALIPGLSILFRNGYIIGSIVAIGVKKLGAIPIILLLVPHGIFEIYAFIYAVGLGLFLPYEVIRNRANLRRVFEGHLRGLLYAAIILFFAAFIEAFVTAKIASLVTS